MELATITMDRDEAQARYEDYRRSAHKDLSKEFARIMRGFKALAKGTRLLDLDKSVQQGGTVTRQRRGETFWLPAIAVGRADKPYSHVRIGDNTVTYDADERGWGRSDKNRVVVQRGELSLSKLDAWTAFRSPTPIVPPEHTPPYALSNYHVLWEADWQPYQPVDPALLRHIGGPIYAVIAEWDLTPLEAAILRDSTVTAR